MSYLNKISGIYIIESIIDSKYYIGRSSNCYERFSKHKSHLRGNKHINSHLQNAWNKYGEYNFTFDVIEENNNIDLLPSLENWWCNMLDTHNRNYGYNIDPTSPFGKLKSSIETIEKIKLSNTGKHPSLETKEKLRLINIGKKLSKETKEKLKNSNKNICIDCYDRNGNFISTYKSLREASRQTKMDVKTIRGSLSCEYNLVKNLIFKYHGEILHDDEIKNRNKNSLSASKVSVVGYKLSGELIGIFDSFYQASKFTGLDPHKISLCCKGKQKRVKDTIWIYFNK
jgi:group I intron endonuclease